MRMRKIPRQNVLFMHDAPSRADNEMVIVCTAIHSPSGVIHQHAAPQKARPCSNHGTLRVFFIA